MAGIVEDTHEPDQENTGRRPERLLGDTLIRRVRVPWTGSARPLGTAAGSGSTLAGGHLGVGAGRVLQGLRSV